MRMEVVSIRMPKWLLEVIDVVIEKTGYTHRSEFVRDAVVRFLQAILRGDGEVARGIKLRMPYAYIRLRGDSYV